MLIVSDMAIVARIQCVVVGKRGEKKIAADLKSSQMETVSMEIRWKKKKRKSVI